jgi:hypothetical protein
MNERRNVPEIVIAICELLRRSQTRINLLFTMSEIPHARPMQDSACEVMFRGRLFGPLCRSSIPSGGARRDRTDDLMLAKHALSQLSYGPVPEDECLRRSMRRIRSIKVVGLGRLELPTSRLSSARSNQLSYKPLTTRSLLARNRLTPDASHKRKPLARVRPRRKRNEDGEIPPMELNDLAIVGP